MFFLIIIIFLSEFPFQLALFLHGIQFLCTERGQNGDCKHREIFNEALRGPKHHCFILGTDYSDVGRLKGNDPSGQNVLSGAEAPRSSGSPFQMADLGLRSMGGTMSILGESR